MAEGGDILQLREEQSQRFTEKWKTQTIALAKMVEDATKPPTGPPKYNSVKLATFSGSFNEDVNEFLTNFERQPPSMGGRPSGKGRRCPYTLRTTLVLVIWFNTSPELAGDETWSSWCFLAAASQSAARGGNSAN